ncbi:hypothetical protein L218DRAFT_985260 [Marasmius fiardii PR-910]|nr:hypothetical protein L218DRAFT_985260 [Marasmius fiardii PR-910]
MSTLNLPDRPTAASARAEAIQMAQDPPPHPGPYQSNQKVLYNKSLTYDHLFNPRHLESVYHSVYGQIFYELTRPYGNLSLYNQYTLWLSCIEGEFYAFGGRGHRSNDEGSEDGSESGESLRIDVEKELESDDEGNIEIPEPAAKDSGEIESSTDGVKPKDGDAHGMEVDDVEVTESFGMQVDNGKLDEEERDGFFDVAEKLFESMATQSNPKGWERFPDFTVVHSRFGRLFLPDSFPDSDSSPEVARSLDPDEDSFDRELTRLLQAAQWELLEYAAWFFTQQPFIESIVLFAAAGIYWQWMVVEKEQVPSLELRKTGPKKWAKAKAAEKAELSGRFSRVYEVGTAASDEAFTKLSDDHLHELGCDARIPHHDQ